MIKIAFNLILDFTSFSKKLINIFDVSFNFMCLTLLERDDGLL
jgi:hypothetical protein